MLATAHVRRLLQIMGVLRFVREKRRLALSSPERNVTLRFLLCWVFIEARRLFVTTHGVSLVVAHGL